MSALFGKEKAEEILKDPNSDQLARDLAHLHLAEQQRIASTKSMYGGDICDEWIRVTLNERGLIDLSDEEAMSLAVEALHVTGVTSIHGVINVEGKADPLFAYPKLVKIANRMIKESKDTNKIFDAHVVLGCLSRRTDPSEALRHFLMATQLQPKNWRIRSELASTYMMMNTLPLCLQSLLAAIDLCPPGRNQFDLKMRKSKVLYNLGRSQDAKASFEQLFQESHKYESEMTDKDRGHLVVAQYMLCQLYTNDGDKKNAYRQWEQAEAKRDSLPPELVKYLDWGARTLAQTCMGSLDPNLLSNQECHNCRKLVKDPKTCSACKVAVYCSKDCQIAAWKCGHKRECKQAKMNRKTKDKEKKKHAAKHDTAIPVDATLDPRNLWQTADKLVRKKGDLQEAVFQYLVALFMDFSLDAQDTTLAKKALAACDEDDPMAIALGLVINMKEQSNVIVACTKAREDIARILRQNSDRRIATDGVRGITSLEDVDRFQFGVAMSFIFQGRIFGRCFAVQSLEQAHNRDNRDAFEDIVRLFSEAGVYLCSNCWLTYQYELGYSNFDVAATDESKRWFGLFLSGLEKAQQKNGSLNRHWTMMKSNAEQKRAMIPLMEMASLRGVV